MAPPAPLISLKDTALGFGGQPLFSGLDLSLSRGERACLVGRNGSGKSTLLKVLAGLQDTDAGERVAQTGARVAYLPQDPALPKEQSVRDFISGGLPHGEEDDLHKVDSMLALLELSGDALLGTLSGGEGRRAALARSLVNAPDVLLLDEPTNHLDLPTIQWLEGELARYRGALLIISHDRAFLKATSNTIVWLDRGKTHKLNKGYDAFDDWSEKVREDEAQELYRLGKKIEQEEHWLHRGVTARRKRNMGRLAKLQELRGQKREMLANRQGQLSMAAAEANKSGKAVIEVKHLTKAYEAPDGSPVPVISDFSTRILRGDRIGIVGRNGAGKTSLVNLLLGRLSPDSGSVKLGTNLEIKLFDQRRESLNYDDTLWETLCPGGGDMLMVGERQKHVVSYLRDFLFSEAQAKQPVGALSGGEKNRLLLARILAQPSNLLVLDEPTNDLDMDTLDLLLEVLDDYQGTLLLVSHDRDFLDRLCTSVILLDGQGNAQEYPGGFTDAMGQAGGLPGARNKRPVAKEKTASKPRSKGPAAKLSYKDQRELDSLPQELEKLAEDIARFEETLATPDLYSSDPARFQKTSDALTAAQEKLESREERWLELEDLRESLSKS
ncbi:ATP-binding cassette domain-containing protein [Rhodovibrionaceae bacterium A322]